MQLTQNTIKQIQKILKKHKIALAYVFGSYATGKVGPLSDFDIAIVFNSKVPQKKHFDIQLRLATDIGLVLKLDRVDVINLESKISPLLRYNAVVKGEVILSKTSDQRYQAYRKALQEYEDTKYLREIQTYYLKKRIKDGTFGKPPISIYSEKFRKMKPPKKL